MKRFMKFWFILLGISYPYEFKHGEYYVVKPMLPEIIKEEAGLQVLSKEYSSGDSLLTLKETKRLLMQHNLMIGQEIKEEGEFLR